MRKFLVELPGAAHLGALHMGLNLSGFRRLLLLLPLFISLLLKLLPLLLFQGGTETLGELGNEVIVGGGKGEQVRRKQRTAGGTAHQAAGFRRSIGGGADTTGGQRDSFTRCD